MTDADAMTRDEILSVCAGRGIKGTDAETAVDAYLDGKEGADTIRVKAVLTPPLAPT